MFIRVIMLLLLILQKTVNKSPVSHTDYVAWFPFINKWLRMQNTVLQSFAAIG